MTTLTLRLDGTPQAVRLGENTAIAMRQAGIATGAAATAAAAAQLFVPFRHPDQLDAALQKVVDVELYETVDQVTLAWPEVVTLREFNQHPDGRTRFRIAEFDGSAYTVLARESKLTAVSINLSATDVGIVTDQPFYAEGTALGVPAGTEVGRIVFMNPGDGFGTYATTNADSVAGLTKKRLFLSTGERQWVDTRAKNLIAQKRNRSPYVDTVIDEYLLGITDDIWVEGGVAGRTYVARPLASVSGSNHTFGFQIYDPVRGALVAIKTMTKAYDWKAEIPDTFVISGAAQGSPRPDVEYVGLKVTMFFKKDFRDLIAWDVPLPGLPNGPTDPVLYGIRPDRVMSVEEVGWRVHSGKGIRNREYTYGPGGDFATLKAATDSLLNYYADAIPDTDDYQRAWEPMSHTCSTANQVYLKPMPGHTEDYDPPVPAGTITVERPDGVKRGIAPWMGLTIELAPDTDLNSSDAYMLDYNLGGRIICPAGSLIRTASTTSASIHQDAQNTLSKPSAANVNDPHAGQQHFRIFGSITGGGTIRATGFPFSGGTSDGQDIRIDGPVLEVTGSASSPNFNTHTSEGNARGGGYTLRNVTTKGGARSFNFQLSDGHTVAARHEVRVENCDVDSVTGDAAFVRVGKQPSVTFDAALAP